MANYISLLGAILRPNLMSPFTDLDRVIFFTSILADFYSSSNTSESIQPLAKIIYITKIKVCSNKKSKPISTRDSINRGLVIKEEAGAKTENNEFTYIIFMNRSLISIFLYCNISEELKNVLHLF